MYNVMIVEDEMLVRIGLKNSVDWSRFGMQVIADLPDGQSALEAYDKDKPDVIITDIRMPRMDGMELISRIREQDRQTRIIVLSCLEEFELARRAMSLGVSGYILKLTMTEDEIATTLNSVRHELDEQRQERTVVSTADSAAVPSASLELVKEKVLKDFLLYGIYSAGEFEQFVRQSGLRLAPARLAVCVVELDQYARLRDKFRDEHGHLIKMTILNMLDEMTTSFERGEGFYMNRTHYLLILSFEDMHSEQQIRQQLRLIARQVQAAVYGCFGGSVSVGISKIDSAYKNLSSLYHEAQQALRHKLLTGGGLLHEPDERLDLVPLERALEQLRDHSPVKALLSLLKQERYSDYIRLLSERLHEDPATMQPLLFQFVQWISTSLYEQHQNEKLLLLDITAELERCDTLPDMLAQVHNYFVRVAEYAHSLLHMSHEIARAIQYIKHNYAQNISLQQVAEHVSLSFGYLSNLFKKELQITFVDYLNRYRIERAKELLIGTNMKSYDIAVQVGFSPEYTYFSKVFKKVTGLNPNEYRRQSLKGGASFDMTGAKRE
ncbi:response regulator [Paenibacillus campi]|uniref:response regulator n=1 Tax=Paenibacillus campi TaxID=3106031 RepID=UPI002B0007EA|nr:response regulator [Paenibacillus sp. SGZ-1014]